MKVRIERTVLAKALKTITPAVSKGGGIPILVGVRIEATSGGLTLTATNGELAIDTTVPADTLDPGIVITPAAHLTRLVASLADDTVELEADGDHLNVASGGTTADLRTLPADEWPRLIAAEGDAVTLNSAECLRIAAILPFASVDQAKPIIQAVHLAPQRVECTDSYRAGIVKVEADLPDVLIPAQALAMVLRQCDAVDVLADGRMVTILSADHATSWRIPTTEGNYPIIEKLIPVDLPHSLRFEADTLRDALLRIDAFSDKDVHTVTLTPDGETVSLAMTQDHGSITETLPILAGSFPGRVGYNAGFLAAVVEAAGEDRVTLELVDALKPTIVRGTRIVMLLMPVRRGVAG